MKQVVGTIAILASILACNPAGKELVGTWKIKEIKEMKEMFMEMEPEKRDAAMKVMESQMAQNKLVFKADGTFSTVTTEGNRAGTWELSEDRKILVTKQGNIDSFEVLNIAPETMTIHGINSDREENFTMVLEKTAE